MNLAILGISQAFASETAPAGGESDEYALKPDQIAFGAINLTIFLVILYFLVRKPISAAIAARAASIRSGLDDAARVQAEAKARFDAVERKLASLDDELVELRVDARKDCDREIEVLKARADVEAARVRESAERAIREETERARAEIRQEAVQIAVKLARETIARSISPQDQERLAREFLAAVDADKPARASLLPGGST